MSNAISHSGVPEFELRHRLGRSLEYAGMKPPAMAAHLEVAENTVRNYLSGRTHPNRATLIAWAFRCGVPVAWIEHGEQPNGPDDGGISSTRWYETPRLVRPYRFDAIAVAA